jgi:hypothetical protein
MNHTRYIHIDSSYNIELYDNNFEIIASSAVSDSNPFPLPSLTSGREYYIKVIRSVPSIWEDYQIACSSSFLAPNTIVNPLAIDAWAYGTIVLTNSYQEWFGFTASGAAQYIHFRSGTTNSIRVQLSDNNGMVGDEIVLNNETKSALWSSLTSGQTYYIHVTRNLVSGSYYIAFNTSATPPQQP